MLSAWEEYDCRRASTGGGIAMFARRNALVEMPADAAASAGAAVLIYDGFRASVSAVFASTSLAS